MLYTIRHVTRYDYPGDVRESVMEVRKHPQSNGFQRCLQFQLRTEPEVRVFNYTDHLQNVVHHFDIPWNHQALTVTAESVVDVKPMSERSNDPSQISQEGSWAELDELISSQDCCEMLQDSRYVTESAALEALCKEFGASQRLTPYKLALELTQAVHSKFAYDRNSTKVDSTVAEVIAARSGVCQDFSHVLLGLLRAAKIPSRYVSGYLFRGQEHLEGPEGRTSHAWVEALLPGFGWLGIDPTLGSLADERHIYNCVGRDYADVPPTRGLFRGPGPGRLSYAVQVHLPDEVQEEDKFRDLGHV